MLQLSHLTLDEAQTKLCRYFESITHTETHSDHFFYDYGSISNAVCTTEDQVVFVDNEEVVNFKDFVRIVKPYTLLFTLDHVAEMEADEWFEDCDMPTAIAEMIKDYVGIGFEE